MSESYKMNRAGMMAAMLAIAIALPAAAVNAGWPDSHSGAYLGVDIVGVTPERASALKLSAPGGAVITYIDQDGPACRAGLKANDVIVTFDGTKIENPAQLAEMIRAASPGKTVVLTVMRAGQRKDVSVALGQRPQAAAHIQNWSPPPPMAFPGPVPPSGFADFDIPSFTALSSHYGVIVESLSPQLSDFFGVSRGHGVLVRSVEQGSPADSAGLKAGDVIVKINSEVVRDMADWRRALRVRTAKVSLGIVRDKHEQTVELTLPGPPDASRLQDQDWQQYADAMADFGHAMEKLGPELQKSQDEMAAAMKPSDREMQEMRRQVQDSMKQYQHDMEKMRRQMQQSLPSQKDMDKMRQELQSSMKLKQEDLDKMRQEIQSSWQPSRQELEQMRRQIEDSMKNWTPQLRQQMEQLRRQMEQQQHPNLQ